MGKVLERKHLAHAVEERFGSVGEHQTGPASQGVGQRLQEVVDDERFASRERKLLHAEAQRLVDERLGVAKRQRLDPVVTGLRPLEAKGASQVAGGPGMEPHFPQPMGLDVPPRLAIHRVEPVVARDVMYGRRARGGRFHVSVLAPKGSTTR